MVNHTSPWINRAEGSGAESTQISFAGKSFPDGQQGTTGDSDSSKGLPKERSIVRTCGSRSTDYLAE